MRQHRQRPMNRARPQKWGAFFGAIHSFHFGISRGTILANMGWTPTIIEDRPAEATREWIPPCPPPQTCGAYVSPLVFFFAACSVRSSRSCRPRYGRKLVLEALLSHSFRPNQRAKKRRFVAAAARAKAMPLLCSNQHPGPGDMPEPAAP